MAKVDMTFRDGRMPSIQRRVKFNSTMNCWAFVHNSIHLIFLYSSSLDVMVHNAYRVPDDHKCAYGIQGNMTII